MIRGKRNDAYGRQTLRVDCCGWESYREAVSYIIIRHTSTNISIVRQFVSKYHPIKIILFGSAARGDFERANDLDFLIIKECAYSAKTEHGSWTRLLIEIYS